MASGKQKRETWYNGVMIVFYEQKNKYTIKKVKFVRQIMDNNTLF